MRLSLIIILVSAWGFGFAQQQEQRKAKRMDELQQPTVSDKKGSGQTRAGHASSFDKVTPSVTVANPADTVHWDKVPQRKLKASKPVNYDEIVK